MDFIYPPLNLKPKKVRPISGFSFRKPIPKDDAETLEIIERDPRDERDGFAFEFPLLCAKLGAINIPQVMIIDPETKQPTSLQSRSESLKTLSPHGSASECIPTQTLIETPENTGVKDPCPSPNPFVIAYFDDDQKQENLRKLVFKGFLIDDAIMTALGNIIIWYDTLQSLHLHKNGLTASLLRRLALYLRNSSIRNINMEENPIPEENYYLLFKEPGLLQISLRKCNITDSGAGGISEELKYKDPPQIQTLKYINLSDNQIGDEGVRLIAEGLRSNRTIEKIVLEKNNIGDKGAIDIASIAMKFPLKTEELKHRQIRKYERARRSNSLMEQKLQDLISYKESQSSVHRRTKRISYSTVSYEDRWKIQQEVAKQMDCDMHPFIWDARPEGLDMWCIGNFHIKELNLSYNKIGVMGVQKILETLQYQRVLRDQEHKIETGLKNVNLQGNVSRQKCPALGKIQDILAVDLKKKNLPRTYRSSSALKIDPCFPTEKDQVSSTNSSVEIRKKEEIRNASRTNWKSTSISSSFFHRNDNQILRKMKNSSTQIFSLSYKKLV